MTRCTARLLPARLLAVPALVAGPLRPDVLVLAAAPGPYGPVLGAEASWVLEDNILMNRPLDAMGATPYRRWRLYEGPLG